MGFEEEHAKWIAYHLSRRKGERRSRLERGHGHSEKMFAHRIWWEMFGNFDDLHPEYEVLDWRGFPFYIDEVWLPGRYAFAFEVDSFGTHVLKADRVSYSRELNRALYLENRGFRVLNIPYDGLNEQPELIRSLLKPILMPYVTKRSVNNEYSRLESEILHLANLLNKPIRPVDLERELEINRRTAVNGLISLSEKGRLRPIKPGKGIRVTSYEMIRTIEDQWLRYR